MMALFGVTGVDLWVKISADRVVRDLNLHGRDGEYNGDRACRRSPLVTSGNCMTATAGEDNIAREFAYQWVRRIGATCESWSNATLNEALRSGEYFQGKRYRHGAMLLGE